MGAHPQCRSGGAAGRMQPCRRRRSGMRMCLRACVRRATGQRSYRPGGAEARGRATVPTPQSCCGLQPLTAPPPLQDRVLAELEEERDRLVQERRALKEVGGCQGRRVGWAGGWGGVAGQRGQRAKGGRAGRERRTCAAGMPGCGSVPLYATYLGRGISARTRCGPSCASLGSLCLRPYRRPRALPSPPTPLHPTPRIGPTACRSWTLCLRPARRSGGSWRPRTAHASPSTTRRSRM